MGNPFTKAVGNVLTTLMGNVLTEQVGKALDIYRGDPSHPPVIEDEITSVPQRGWAEMIKKVYEVDPLLCPQCGGEMKVISFIEDHKVIDRIIGQLKLIFVAERPPPPQVVQHELVMAAEEREGYF